MHAEREGEWSDRMSVDNARSSVDAHVSEVPGHDDDARYRLNGLSNTSEWVSERSQRPVNVYVPYAAHIEDTMPDVEPHAPEASRCYEDALNRPKESLHTPEHVSQRPERQVNPYPPAELRVKHVAPNAKVDASGAYAPQTTETGALTRRSRNVENRVQDGG